MADVEVGMNRQFCDRNGFNGNFDRPKAGKMHPDQTYFFRAVDFSDGIINKHRILG